MFQITFNTGDKGFYERYLIPDERFAQLSELVSVKRGDVPGMSGWTFYITTLVAGGGAYVYICHGEDKILLCGIAWQDGKADEVWDITERIYLGQMDDLSKVMRMNDEEIGNPPDRPLETPWVAMVLLPHFFQKYIPVEQIKEAVNFARQISLAISEAEGVKF